MSIFFFSDTLQRIQIIQQNNFHVKSAKRVISLKIFVQKNIEQSDEEIGTKKLVSKLKGIFLF